MSILMMMSTVLIGDNFNFAAWSIDKLLNSPAEAAGVVGVYRLQDEQDRSYFKEQDGTDESSDSTAIIDLAIEFTRWHLHRQPRKEALFTQSVPDDITLIAQSHTLMTQTTLPHVKINATSQEMSQMGKYVKVLITVLTISPG